MWICPNCEAEIDELRFEVSTTSCDYGSATLSDTNEMNHIRDRVVDHNTEDNGDTDWDGNPTYRCPECDDDVQLGDLVWLDPDKKKKIEEKLPPAPPEPEETKHLIIKPGIILEIEHGFSNDPTTTMMICKHCRHLFMYETHEYHPSKRAKETYECPKCGKTTNALEYQELVAKGFFSTKRRIINLKKQNVKKNTHRSVESVDKSRKPIHSQIFRSKRIQKSKTR